jgi:tetratricopeptide (TPR) repeat protein
MGDFDEALHHLQQALEVFQDEQLVLDQTMTLNSIAEIYARTPDPAASRRHFHEAYRQGSHGGSTFQQARALSGLAAAAATAGQPDRAAVLIRRAEALNAGLPVVSHRTPRQRRPVDEDG